MNDAVWMDHPAILKSLRDLGIPQKAGMIYMSLLGKQKMTLSEISRETSLKRATCYEYVDQLLQRNLVVRSPVGKRMFYAAVEPKRILNDVKKRVLHLENQIEEMTSLHNTAVNKPRIVFYEGKAALRNIYEEMFKTVGDAASIFPPASFFENFTLDDYAEFDKDYAKHAFKGRDLFIVDKYYRKIKEIRAKNGGERTDKKLPSWFTSNVDVLIYADKVALISLRDLSAIVIENKDIADLFKNMHSFMWKSL